jgi:hypothetical protein
VLGDSYGSLYDALPLLVVVKSLVVHVLNHAAAREITNRPRDSIDHHPYTPTYATFTCCETG